MTNYEKYLVAMDQKKAKNSKVFCFDFVQHNKLLNHKTKADVANKEYKNT